MKFRARPLRDEGIGWWMKDGRKMERIRCLSVVELLGEWLCVSNSCSSLPYIISDHKPCLENKNFPN